MSAEEACGELMRKVADCDVPGNILYEAFHNSPNKSAHSVDPRRRKPVESPPAPPALQPRIEVSAGGRGGSRFSGRSDYTPVVSTDVTSQDHGLGPESVLQGSGPSLQPVHEVGLPIVRWSSRQRSNVVPFQAGSSGMEHT